MIVYDPKKAKAHSSPTRSMNLVAYGILWHCATRFRGTPSDVQRTGGGLESKGAEGTYGDMTIITGHGGLDRTSNFVHQRCFGKRCCWLFEESLRG